MARYSLRAQDMMQVEVATILGDASVADAAAHMRREGVRSLIIEPRSQDDPYAIVTYSDIVNKVLAEGRDPAKVPVYEIMTKPLISVPPDMKAEYIARLFHQSGIGHAPVMDCGQLLGVISMTDLITEVIADPE